MILSLYTALVRLVLWILGAKPVQVGPRAYFFNAAKIPLLANRFGLINAVTLGRVVIFRDENALAMPQIRRHELIHIRQLEETGALRFYATYAKDYLAARARGADHRTAYRGIRWESAAYADEERSDLTDHP